MCTKYKLISSMVFRPYVRDFILRILSWNFPHLNYPLYYRLINLKGKSFLNLVKIQEFVICKVTNPCLLIQFLLKLESSCRRSRGYIPVSHSPRHKCCAFGDLSPVLQITYSWPTDISNCILDLCLFCIIINRSTNPDFSRFNEKKMKVLF